MERKAMSSFSFEELNAELRDLKDNQRPTTVVEISTVKSHGGLKENVKHHAAGEKQALMEGRTAELGGILSRVQVIDPASYPHNSVKFSSGVPIMDLESEKESKHTLVGTYKSDLEKGYISIASPPARAMLGKKEGDESKMRLPRGESEFEIISTVYEPLKF